MFISSITIFQRGKQMRVVPRNGTSNAKESYMYQKGEKIRENIHLFTVPARKKKSMTFHSSILNTNSHNALCFTSTFTLLDIKMLTYLDHVCSGWQDGDPTFLLS